MFDMENGRLMERMCLEYYRHFANFIKPGAVRIASTKYTDQLDLTAWENIYGDKIFVLLNRQSEDKTCYLRINGQQFQFVIPSNAIISGRIEEENC